jgi:predicted metal-dependent hydrolase
MPARQATVLQNGRRKAYRPIAAADRRAAFEAAVAAYGRGDYFEAHELLEPAWMGTDDLAERELYQGLIKLAAAFVHGVRGNPRGVAKNLDGAQHRLTAALAADAPAGGIDLAALITDVDERLAALAADPDDRTTTAPILRRPAR